MNPELELEKSSSLNLNHDQDEIDDNKLPNKENGSKLVTASADDIPDFETDTDVTDTDAESDFSYFITAKATNPNDDEDETDIIALINEDLLQSIEDGLKTYKNLMNDLLLATPTPIPTPSPTPDNNQILIQPLKESQLIDFHNRNLAVIKDALTTSYDNTVKISGTETILRIQQQIVEAKSKLETLINQQFQDFFITKHELDVETIVEKVKEWTMEGLKSYDRNLEQVELDGKTRQEMIQIHEKWVNEATSLFHRLLETNQFSPEEFWGFELNFKLQGRLEGLIYEWSCGNPNEPKTFTDNMGVEVTDSAPVTSIEPVTASESVEISGPVSEQVTVTEQLAVSDQVTAVEPVKISEPLAEQVTVSEPVTMSEPPSSPQFKKPKTPPLKPKSKIGTLTRNVQIKTTVPNSKNNTKSHLPLVAAVKPPSTSALPTTKKTITTIASTSKALPSKPPAKRLSTALTAEVRTTTKTAPKTTNTLAPPLKPPRRATISAVCTTAKTTGESSTISKDSTLVSNTKIKPITTTTASKTTSTSVTSKTATLPRPKPPRTSLIKAEVRSKVGQSTTSPAKTTTVNNKSTTRPLPLVANKKPTTAALPVKTNAKTTSAVAAEIRTTTKTTTTKEVNSNGNTTITVQEASKTKPRVSLWSRKPLAPESKSQPAKATSAAKSTNIKMDIRSKSKANPEASSQSNPVANKNGNDNTSTFRKALHTIAKRATGITAEIRNRSKPSTNTNSSTKPTTATAINSNGKKPTTATTTKTTGAKRTSVITANVTERSKTKPKTNTATKTTTAKTAPVIAAEKTELETRMINTTTTTTTTENREENAYVEEVVEKSEIQAEEPVPVDVAVEEGAKETEVAKERTVEAVKTEVLVPVAIPIQSVETEKIENGEEAPGTVKEDDLNGEHGIDEETCSDLMETTDNADKSGIELEDFGVGTTATIDEKPKSDLDSEYRSGHSHDHGIDPRELVHETETSN